jgi:hypothetical protein
MIIFKIKSFLNLNKKSVKSLSYFSTSTSKFESKKDALITLFNKKYQTDEWTNISDNIKSKLDRQLLHQKYHPLNHLKNRIKHFFQTNYLNPRSPIFSIYDNFDPVVTVHQNFDR